MELPKLDPAQQQIFINFISEFYWGFNSVDNIKAQLEKTFGALPPAIHIGDNLFTWGRNNSFLEDVRFREAWESNSLNSADQGIVWRRYILACAAYHCVQLEGDFVECGVYMGTGIKTVLDYLGGKSFPKTFWGYDTFDYNPTGHTFEGQQEGLYNRVLDRFEEYDCVKLVKGFLPDVLVGNQPEKISYLHIDLNNLDAEVSVLESLFEKVATGGIVILDDYEWAAYRQQKIGEDQWFDKRQYRVFPLPTGQGLIIKR